MLTELIEGFAPQHKLLVYKYIHTAEFFTVPEPHSLEHNGFASPVSSQHFRHPAFLLVWVRNPRLPDLNKVQFIHRGKRGNYPGYVRSGWHGKAAVCEQDGDTHLTHVWFNWAGEGHTPRRLQFVQVDRFAYQGLLYVQGMPPWCVTMRLHNLEDKPGFWRQSLCYPRMTDPLLARL